MIPHVTQYEQADVTELEAFRLSMNESLKKEGVRLTILAFVIKAVVSVLKRYPEFNASLDEAGENLILKKYWNVGFAADTAHGLVVPVVKDADKKGVVDIAKEMAELSKHAREGKLQPSEMQGATFTITSLGGIGGTYFTPLINAPEVAILGLSKLSMQPVWNGKEFVPRLILPLSLGYDHRVIDGAQGTRFTTYLAEVLADMRQMIL
jgi:pyruvate dehydrogenase E2 component (dihydrolipoamide acetyltransferase)